ncbi:sialidase family protein [Mycoplasma nasistruthionis]|uniref:Exo-alpha-sialidase n=1 Tax=Mycoplasma nasistruthionis TaxID=353852 RepID=A0A4Y6I6H8_9MOLU|nr:sialidase family protein [Mycoplasma nasistruthionis]QDF64847.1 exo-alpha-sialidase [Mycoplasma nasistruthionis]
MKKIILLALPALLVFSSATIACEHPKRIKKSVLFEQPVKNPEKDKPPIPVEPIETIKPDSEELINLKNKLIDKSNQLINNLNKLQQIYSSETLTTYKTEVKENYSYNLNKIKNVSLEEVKQKIASVDEISNIAYSELKPEVVDLFKKAIKDFEKTNQNNLLFSELPFDESDLINAEKPKLNPDFEIMKIALNYQKYKNALDKYLKTVEINAKTNDLVKWILDKNTNNIDYLLDLKSFISLYQYLGKIENLMPIHLFNNVENTQEQYDFDDLLNKNNTVAKRFLTPSENIVLNIYKPNIKDDADTNSYNKLAATLKSGSLPVIVVAKNTQNNKVSVYPKLINFSNNVPELKRLVHLYDNNVFPGPSNGSHSYRIPGAIKLDNNEIIIKADKRIKSNFDAGYIDQVLKRYTNLKEQNNNQELIVTIDTGARHNHEGQTVDGQITKVTMPDGSSKLIYLFGLFKKNYHVMFNSNDNTLWTNDNDIPENTDYSGFVNKGKWRKIELRGNKATKIIAKPIVVDNKTNWWKLFKLKDQTILAKNINDQTELIPLNAVIDNSYDPETRKITGRVYDNIPSSIFNTFGENSTSTKAQIQQYITQDSVWDGNSKYNFQFTEYEFMLESTDNGHTWGNLRDFYPLIANDVPKKTQEYFLNSVGNGVQLKYQTGENAKYNNRILLPLYKKEIKKNQHCIFTVMILDKPETMLNQELIMFPNRKCLKV